MLMHKRRGSQAMDPAAALHARGTTVRQAKRSCINHNTHSIWTM